MYKRQQLTELGIPVVIAINMIDVVEKNGDKIDVAALSEALGCRIVTISALKGRGIEEAANAVVEAAKAGVPVPMHTFSGVVEHAVAHIEEAALHDMPAERQRYYAVKLFERDEKVREQLGLAESVLAHIETDIQAAESEMDDDAESIITNERYIYIASLMKACYRKKSAGRLTVSDKIDKVVTNRFLALPIFAVIMFLVYYISVSTVGTWATDWANDGLFGDGWHLFGIGSAAYNEVAEQYGDASAIVDGYDAYVEENGAAPEGEFTYEVEDEETLEITEETATLKDYEKALATLDEIGDEPDPADYGVWVPGIPVLIGNALEAAGAAEWLSGLILDGIVAGVGAVLGFVPQMLILFLLLSILEDIGYMARVAFIMDRIFRKFGLSGKSFIPMLIGSGCGVPGVMASRTIENERDRRMTVMTTCFIPCGAKLPIIGMISGAFFDNAWWVATSAYFVGVAAIIVSGIILKKIKAFAGDAAPFVMELPPYHAPAASNVFRATWERGWSFIKRAGTLILLSAVVIWFLQAFGVTSAGFGMVEDNNDSLLAAIGGAVAFIFAPLGFGIWQATVGVVGGLVAKENLVTIMAVCYGFAEVGETGEEIWGILGTSFSPIAGYSFMVFNLLCAPCFAAMGAIKREMNSPKWTVGAIGYMCGFAYLVSLMIYQFGGLITGELSFGLGTVAAIVVLAGLLYMLFRKNRYSEYGGELSVNAAKKDVKVNV